jgi:hypothetical protein
MKPRNLPLKVPVTEALSCRLHLQHPKYTTILNEHSTYSAGYLGEKSLDYHLSTLPQKGYNIFHGLCLMNYKYHSRFDTLIFTRKLALILEIKYYTGDIFLDTRLNQLIQTKNGVREVYPCPILQAQRQKLELENWLRSHHYDHIPVEYLVVFANKRVYLETHPGDEKIFEQITKSPDIKNRVEKLERKHSEDKISEKELSKLSKTLLKSHITQSSIEIFNEYKINCNDIIPGVQCPCCGRYAMKYQHRAWICPHCYHRSKTAHEKAIQDYFLLIKSTITNAELRQFIQLPNARIANKILKNLNIPYTGNNKARVYHAPKVYPFYQ